MSRCGLASALVVAALTAGGPSFAEGEGDKVAAKQAYDRGVEAYRRGDMPTAAREFARADALAPNPVALQAALDAAIEADDPDLAAELVARSRRAPPPPGLAASITAAHVKYKDQLERRSSADEPAASSTEPAPAGEASPSTRKLPPIFAYGGAGLTALLAGATAYFALDTASTHESFVTAGCRDAALPECAGLKDDGESSQTLANVGFVSVAIVGIATAAVAILFTDWSAPVFGRVDRRGAAATWRWQF